MRRSTFDTRRGFSLVELVIVIVIIGIIAAIDVPRVSRGASAANDAALRASLHTLRACISMYAAEHEGALPGEDGKSKTAKKQLTKNTDILGNVGNTPGVHIYGPYLLRIPLISVGPNIGAKKMRMTLDSPPLVDESKKNHGWVYNYTTGEIIANTDDLDANGVGYDTY